MSTEQARSIQGSFNQPLWASTACEPVEAPRLDQSLSTDVLVIGAGITGLSTALHLAEGGTAVCVLDAQALGWGASGLNGGQVIPGLKHDPDALIARHGQERGETLIRMIGSAADTVFDLVSRYNIVCDATRKGWIQPAHSAKSLAVVLNRARQWERRGAPVEMLERDALARRLGTDAYLGGWVDLRAGSLHPLNYVRGLARTAQAKGARIHAHSRVLGLKRQAQAWIASTETGATVRASHVVIATNAYTDSLWPGLQQSVLAANSFVLATAPLTPELRARILPGREVVSDARRLLRYWRCDADGRFILGGRGPFRDPSSGNDWNHLQRSVQRLYPALQGVPIDYRWCGRVAITLDGVPHLHEPAPGLTITLGYNGRGIAMATQLGVRMASRIAFGAQLDYPVTKIQAIPLHALHRLYLGAGIAFYGLLDALS